ncbi:hypothetical protein BOTCAL_0427g00030 [Botryotinia calthae]|uniref:Uncharacterized protein n=1 Tax=Botryotinia calthae TaxID=38488 RepID=A0A4Y8CQU6_9HELO|nr:hypothetical protein BOTCAL_0427g00030 [Botryotinia calthae]
MMEVKEEGSTILGAGKENQAVAGVGEENSKNDREARYSEVRFSKNMTCEELLESLKHLTGPGAEDERKRRVIKWTQTEKGRRRAAEAQARNKEKKIEKIKKIQLRKESKMVRDAQMAERTEIADAKLRWAADHPEEAAKRRGNNKGARKRAAKKAEKRLLAESQNAREGSSTAADRNMAKSGAARGVHVGGEAVEAGAMNDAEEMAGDDADVNLIKGLEYTENSTFSLVIRQR